LYRAYFIKKNRTNYQKSGRKFTDIQSQMAKRSGHFLLTMLLILPLTMFSQQQMPRIAQKTSHTLKFPGFLPGIKNEINVGVMQKKLKFFEPVDQGPVHSPVFNAVQPDFYTRRFGFFCQKELQLEKLTNVPLRFRLGSLEYVDRVEGKK
jgi:hypothetical protein